MTAPGDRLSFEQDIKPLFRQKDRDAMLAAFDLFDYDDVVEKADAIVGSLRSGHAVRRRVARRAGGQAAAVDRRGHARLTNHRHPVLTNVERPPLAPRRFS